MAEFYNPYSLRYLVKKLTGPARTGARVNESDVMTRWDAPWRIADLLPDELELVGLRGLRIVTPAAVCLELPALGRLWGKLESTLSDYPALAFVGGFVVARCYRR